MLLNEVNHMCDEFWSGSRIVNQFAVFAAFAVIPSSKSQSNFDSIFLEFCNLPVEIFPRVSYMNQVLESITLGMSAELLLPSVMSA